MKVSNQQSLKIIPVKNPDIPEKCAVLYKVLFDGSKYNLLITKEALEDNFEDDYSKVLAVNLILERAIINKIKLNDLDSFINSAGNVFKFILIGNKELS